MGKRSVLGIACMVTTVLVLATRPSATAGQERPGERIVPTNETIITGYGTVGYALRTQGERINAFTAGFSPVFLFQFQDRVLFEAELEFDLREGVTETGLEYAQVDYIVNDNLILVGGKFLLPFGVFGPEIHPTWINKLPEAPPLYGHHVTEFGAEPLLPILSDVGVMARAAFNPGRVQIAINAYGVQGPTIEAEEDGIPELGFPASSSDENTDKMFGTRLDLALPPWVRMNVSYINGDYDVENVLDFTAWNVAAEFRAANVEIRGEYIQTREEIETPTGFPTLARDGFYAQAAYRIGPWEPVFRWTQVFESDLEGVIRDAGAWQAALGLDYWFNPSIAVMGAYEINRESGLEIDNDRFAAHIAFGF